MAFSFLEVISELCGWVYTICWSLSFYPQPLLNFRRKSTTGTTIDFPAINVLGFVGYFISNAAFLYSPRIREEYALRNHGLTPTVQFNDFAFAAHAIVLSAITLSQFVPSLWGFERRAGPGSRPSRFIMGIFISSILGVIIVAFIVLVRDDPDPATGWAWIDVVCPSARPSVRYADDKCYRSTLSPTLSSSSHSSNTCLKFLRIIEIEVHKAGLLVKSFSMSSVAHSRFCSSESTATYSTTGLVLLVIQSS